jgi:hypothetical protein
MEIYPLGAGTALNLVSAAKPGIEGGRMALALNNMVHTPPSGYKENDDFLYTDSDGVHTGHEPHPPSTCCSRHASFG